MVPFQYSIHVADAPGAIADPRRELAEALLADLGDRGSVLTYSPYEARVIRDLANEYAALVWGDVDDPDEVQRTLKSLREYCRQDTLAMVRLHERLVELAA